VLLLYSVDVYIYMCVYMYLHIYIYEQIQNDVLEFPADVAMSPGLKRLLSGMMIKDPAKRMRLEQVSNRFLTVTSVTVVSIVWCVVQACVHALAAMLLQHAKVH
jgi:hypothetical protein